MMNKVCPSSKDIVPILEDIEAFLRSGVQSQKYGDNGISGEKSCKGKYILCLF